MPSLPVTLPLSLREVQPLVFSLHSADGQHLGYLKRIGAVWKFKAVGYDAQGQLEPGSGPLTHQHNQVFASPDEAEVNARLGSTPTPTPNGA